MWGEAGMTMEEILLKYKGKLRILNDPQFKVKSKLPWCDLNTQLSVAISNGETKINSKDTYISYTLSNVSLSIYFNDVLITHSAPVPGPLHALQNGQLLFDNIFNTLNLIYIESLRNGDISFRFTISGYYSSTIGDTNYYESVSPQDIFSVSIVKKFSEREWLKLLSEMGYGEKMVIAIDKPKLEGYHEVLEFIEKANEGLLNNNNPDYIISDLRSAWDKLDVYILKFNKDLKNYINSKSKKEDNQPTKDERVESINKSIESYLDSIRLMKESIDKFVQIGPHKEIYHSTREDAVLAFRLTVSLMSYYSSILKKIADNDVK